MWGGGGGDNDLVLFINRFSTSFWLAPCENKVQHNEWYAPIYKSPVAIYNHRDGHFVRTTSSGKLFKANCAADFFLLPQQSTHAHTAR